MATELQRQFARSRVLRRGMREILGAATGRGCKKLWDSIIADVYADMSEAQIKCCLYAFLNSYDIMAADRAEVLRLLQLSETVLTAEQRRQIASLLQAR